MFVFSYIPSLPLLSSSYLSAVQRSSIISLFRLGSTARQQQPHLCVCQSVCVTSLQPLRYTQRHALYDPAHTEQTTLFISAHSFTFFVLPLLLHPLRRRQTPKDGHYLVVG